MHKIQIFSNKTAQSKHVLMKFGACFNLSWVTWFLIREKAMHDEKGSQAFRNTAKWSVEICKIHVKSAFFDNLAQIGENPRKIQNLEFVYGQFKTAYLWGSHS